MERMKSPGSGRSRKKNVNLPVFFCIRSMFTITFVETETLALESTGFSHPLQKDEVLLARFVNWTGAEGLYVGREWDE